MEQSDFNRVREVVCVIVATAIPFYFLINPLQKIDFHCCLDIVALNRIMHHIHKKHSWWNRFVQNSIQLHTHYECNIFRKMAPYGDFTMLDVKYRIKFPTTKCYIIDEYDFTDDDAFFLLNPTLMNTNTRLFALNKSIHIDESKTKIVRENMKFICDYEKNTLFYLFATNKIRGFIDVHKQNFEKYRVKPQLKTEQIAGLADGERVIGKELFHVGQNKEMFEELRGIESKYFFKD